jgi:putative oxidoreductase
MTFSSKIVKNLVHTEHNHASLIIRFVLGAVLFAHGTRGALGWFDGPGFSGMITYLTQAIGLPYVVGLLVIFLQFFGSMMLIAGVITRAVAIATCFMFAGMVVSVHIEHGFFMNWHGTRQGEGYEYHILVMAMCLGLLITGGGSWSVDRLLTRKMPV